VQGLQRALKSIETTLDGCLESCQSRDGLVPDRSSHVPAHTSAVVVQQGCHECLRSSSDTAHLCLQSVEKGLEIGRDPIARGDKRPHEPLLRNLDALLGRLNALLAGLDALLANLQALLRGLDLVLRSSDLARQTTELELLHSHPRQSGGTHLPLPSR